MSQPQDCAHVSPLAELIRAATDFIRAINNLATEVHAAAYVSARLATPYRST